MQKISRAAHEIQRSVEMENRLRECPQPAVYRLSATAMPLALRVSLWHPEDDVHHPLINVSLFILSLPLFLPPRAAECSQTPASVVEC